MVVKKRKKLAHMRGSRTHGYGRAHRGSGNKGGYGNASSGKKSDTKKRSFPADYFGKEGFKLHVPKPLPALSIRNLDIHIEAWTKEGIAKHEGDIYTIDLLTLGYGKLVGGGRLTHKIKVTVRRTSEGPADKVKKAGGELVLA